MLYLMLGVARGAIRKEHSSSLWPDPLGLRSPIPFLEPPHLEASILSPERRSIKTLAYPYPP
jgi:hypothetical protein